MIQLKEVDFDGDDYYLASDADERVDELIEEITDLEGKLIDADDEIEYAAIREVESDDFKDDYKRLKVLLEASLVVFSNCKGMDVEINYEGRVTDIDGFISDIEWELKA